MINAALQSPLLLGLRTFLSPLEAVTALEGTLGHDRLVSPILNAAWPLLMGEAPVPTERKAVVDAFRTIPPDRWKAILQPDRQAVADSLQRFQPHECLGEMFIQQTRKALQRKRGKGERWLVCGRDLLLNPKRNEILSVSRQQKGSAKKLRGLKLGSIVDAACLPETLLVYGANAAPYLFSDNPDFKRLAYGASLYLRGVREENLVLYYGSEQWDVADFCVTGAIILHNANASENSGLPEDYRIIHPGDPVAPFHFAPFVPVARPPQSPRPPHRFIMGRSGESRLMSLIFGGKIPSAFVQGPPVRLSRPRKVEGRQIFSVRKGTHTLILSAPEGRENAANGLKHGKEYLLPTPRMIAAFLKAVPESLLEGLEKIRIVDESRPDRSADAGGGGIRFFRLPQPTPFFAMWIKTEKTLYHELGHHWTQHRFGSHHMKNHSGWLAVMQKDGNSPSLYAQKNLAEDFAESVALYFETEAGLSGDARRHHPHRFTFLDTLFWDVLKPSARKKIRKLR